MRFNDASAREAYRCGARASYDSATPYLDARQERAILEWLTELDAWQGGDPPPSPAAWIENA